MCVRAHARARKQHIPTSAAAQRVRVNNGTLLRPNANAHARKHLAIFHSNYTATTAAAAAAAAAAAVAAAPSAPYWHSREAYMAHVAARI